MEEKITKSTPIFAGWAEPLQTGGRQSQKQQAARSICPACRFGTYLNDRFCRRCGINLEQWRTASPTGPTVPLVEGQNSPAGLSRFDLVVIGSGPAGQKGAIAAAKLGKRVAIVDRSEMIGGMSLHTVTIPSKTLREAVLYLTGYRQRAFYGRDYKLKQEISVADLAERVNTVVARQMAVIREQIGRNGVAVIDGTARFSGPHTLEVEGRQGVQSVEADYFLIACGTRAARPPEILFGDRVVDTDQLGQIDSIPRDMIVVGAGMLGLEYASMLSALGVKVTVIDQQPTMLDFLDREIVEALSYHMRRQGADFRLGEKVTSAGVGERGQVQVGLESGKRLQADRLLYAPRRQANGDMLNLEAAGLEPDWRGQINVNEYFQSAVDHIYAAGDCIGFPALAATSMEQGRLAAYNIFGRPVNARLSLFPYGIYTIPEISMVGRTEQELTRAGIPYETGVARYEEVAKGQIVGDETGMLKILFHPKTLELLGVHAIGENATEIIHIGQTVLALDGTVEFLRDIVFNYPTFAEAYNVAALNGLNKL